MAATRVAGPVMLTLNSSSILNRFHHRAFQRLFLVTCTHFASYHLQLNYCPTQGITAPLSQISILSDYDLLLLEIVHWFCLETIVVFNSGPNLQANSSEISGSGTHNADYRCAA